MLGYIHTYMLHVKAETGKSLVVLGKAKFDSGH